MVCSLNTCFTHLEWAFWKSPGLFTLDLFSTWYLEHHVQCLGLMMFSPFLFRLGFWGFWHSDTVHSSEKGFGRFGSRSTQIRAGHSGLILFLHCLQSQIPLLGRAPVCPSSEPLQRVVLFHKYAQLNVTEVCPVGFKHFWKQISSVT